MVILYGLLVMFVVMDFVFLGGSMGSVVGEEIVCVVEYVVESCILLLFVVVSGGV